MNKQLIPPVILALLGLMIIRSLLYCLVIPFDRSPDEAHYFKLIKAKQLQMSQASAEEIQRTTSRLAWQTYYLLYPHLAPEKRTIDDFADAELPKPPSSLQVYYLLNAELLRLLSLENIRDEIFVIRGFSMFCGVLTVWLAFLVTRELFPDSRFMLIGVPAFITFLPQFTAMSGVVDNDKLTGLCLGVMAWLLVRMMKQGLLTWYSVAYLVLMGVAILGKRTALFTIPLLLVIAMLSYRREPLNIRVHLAVIGVFFVPIIGMFGLLEMPIELKGLLKEYIVAIAPWQVRDFLLHEAYRPAQLKYYAKFFTVFYWSFWGLFGYMTIHIHHFWYLLAAAWQGAAIAGLWKWGRQLKRKTAQLDAWKLKTLYLFGVSIVYVILIVFLRSVVFRPDNPMLSQGRRLFVVIIPVSVLTVLGLERLFPAKHHRWVGGLALVGLFIMDSVILSRYLLINFHSLSLF